jgi:hypothetical protein
MKREQLIITIYYEEEKDMTTAQVEHLLDLIGYPYDEWTTLESVPMIQMSQDTNVYTDPTRVRVKFNTESENMEIVYGSIQNSAFVSDAGETEDYTPASFVSFGQIMGLMQSVYPGSQGVYYKRPFPTNGSGSRILR